MNAVELANLLGVHYNTIYNMIKKGELKAEKVGRKYEVDEVQAQRLIKAKDSYNLKLNRDAIINPTVETLESEKYKVSIELLENIKVIAEKYEIVLRAKDRKNLKLEDDAVKSRIEKIMNYDYTKKLIDNSKEICKLNEMIEIFKSIHQMSFHDKKQDVGIRKELRIIENESIQSNFLYTFDKLPTEFLEFEKEEDECSFSYHISD